MTERFIYHLSKRSLTLNRQVAGLKSRMRPSDLISLNGHIFLLLTTDFFFRQNYSPGRYCVKAYQQRSHTSRKLVCVTTNFYQRKVDILITRLNVFDFEAKASIKKRFV